jgi:hypothetical protein
VYYAGAKPQPIWVFRRIQSKLGQYCADEISLGGEMGDGNVSWNAVKNCWGWEQGKGDVCSINGTSSNGATRACV